MKGFIGFFVNFLIMIGVLAFFGCTATQTGEGEWGFKQNTEWAFYHRAVSDEKTSSTNIEFPALVDFVLGED